MRQRRRIDLSGWDLMDDVNWAYVSLIVGLMVVLLVIMLLIVGTIFGICALVVRILDRKRDVEKDLDFTPKERKRKMRDQGLL